jgi:hypothetical protein
MISIGIFSRQNERVSRALFFCLVTTLFNLFAFSAFALVDTQGSWEKVEDANVTKGKRFYVRGSGYYTDNTLALSNSESVSGILRLVVTESSMDVINAHGSDDNGHLYFDLTSTDDTTRMWFAKKRGAFNYVVEVQQWIVDAADSDGDGIPDSEDICPADPDNDADSDGICGDIDICPIDPDNDVDADGICGDIDICPADPDNDVDFDGICGDIDICPADPDNDVDSDGICGDIDICPADPDNDADSDGICGDVDVCPADPLNDADEDNICDSEDICLGDPTNSCISIVGLVFGNGAAVNAAAVKVGLNSVEVNTDLSGEFTANVGGDVLASDGIDSFFPVKVKAKGFASGNAKVVWQAGKTEYQISIDLQQVSQVITEDDDVTQGVEINKDGAPVGSLTIPTNSLPTGVSAITGSITYLDPETDDILSTPGGDLLALPEGADPNDGQVTLETFGMMEFDLVDQDGNAITELATGETAEVCMKATSGLSLGDTVPLWYYDEDAGLWKEEGQGMVEDRDGELQICGAVGHFSWWNYDQPISTHSCMKYSIESEFGDVNINALSWFVEGGSYNGTSPSRSCSNDNGSTQFDSFTVKITTDTDNPEQIKVYTNIGGSKFYLLADGDNTFSLTQSSVDAAIFNTPDVQGSCLSNTQSGTCMNLDHQTDNNGVLPLSADVNLPPVIMEFTASSGTLLPGETADVMATVTDPENSNVTLDWTVSCGYYGNNNGSEFMTPGTESGTSGQQFSAVMTAPDSLSYPIEYCEITLVATDANALFSTATRWVPVAASFEFQLNGTVFGIDGLPLANTTVEYINYACYMDNNLFQSTTTDENGQYQLNIDLASCISQEGGYSDLGQVQVAYMYDGRSWQSEFWLNDYYYGGLDARSQDYCSIALDGATLCDIDTNLPVLWGPVSGNVYLSADIDPVGFSAFSMNAYQNSILGGFSVLNDDISLDLSSSPASFGPIMAPVGELFVHHYYRSLGGEGESQSNEGNNSSTDGTAVDIGNLLTTVPVVISVFDATNQPMANVEIDFQSSIQGTGNVIDIEGTTDSNGEYMANAYLGYLNGNSSNPFRYYGGYVIKAGSTVYIDLGSRQDCLVEGQLVDIFGVPIANEFFNIFGNLSGSNFVTDENGYFSTTANPGYFQIEGQNYQSGYFGNNYVNNCRPVAGLPRVIRFDAVMYEGFFGLE